MQFTRHWSLEAWTRAAVVVALWLMSPAAIDAADSLFQTDVFVSGQGGYLAYRIPALVTTPSGSLLVFCEARKTSLEDDGDIDLLVCRSDDQGRNWQQPQLVIEEGGTAQIKFGNPTAVVDRETGKIWVAVNRDYLDEQGGRQGGAFILLHSADDGLTWSPPRDITKEVKGATWKHHAFGPGIGIQLGHGHKGRLILPGNFRESFDKRQPSWSHIIYSDDHGATWRAGGQLGDYTNECQLVEVVNNGEPSLLLNARNHRGRAGMAELSGRRLVAHSTDGGLTWSPEQMDPALPDPPCQASLFRFSFPSASEPGQILFANPAGPGRSHLTIRMSTDDGKTWPVSRLLYEGSAAYSCLTRLPNGEVGIIFERDNYGRLTFAWFPVDWLTSTN